MKTMKNRIIAVLCFIILVLLPFLMNFIPDISFTHALNQNKVNGSILYRFDNSNDGNVQFKIKGQLPTMALLIRTRDDLTIIEEAVPAYQKIDNRSYIQPLPQDAQSYDAETNTTTLSLKIPMRAQYQYIGSLKAVTRAQNQYRFFAIYTVGILFLCCLVTLLLYGYKPSERYLLFFAIYSFSVFVWCLLSFLEEGRLLREFGSKHLYSLTMLLNFIACVQLAETHQNKHITRRRCLLYAGLYVIVFSLDVFYPKWTSSMLRIVPLAAGLLVLLKNSRTRTPDDRLLMELLALTQLLRILMVLRYSLAENIGFYANLYRYTRLSHISFLYMALVFILKYFSDKFVEAEALASELDNANALLEHKVELRTAQLVEQQGKNRIFITNIFHDLRTPLFISKGWLDILKDKIPQELDALSVVNDQINYVSNLVNDLFLLSKLEDGQQILETEVVDISQMVRSVIASSALACQKRSIKMETNISSGCKTWGDSLCLRRTFENLLSNAIRYTNEGGIIHVSLIQEENSLLFQVSDTGSGIAEDDLLHIFDRYYTVSKQEKQGSAGLGLPICKEIVHAHQGSIWVESALGQGSVFSIRLRKL